MDECLIERMLYPYITSFSHGLSTLAVLKSLSFSCFDMMHSIRQSLCSLFSDFG